MHETADLSLHVAQNCKTSHIHHCSSTQQAWPLACAQETAPGLCPLLPLTPDAHTMYLVGVFSTEDPVVEDPLTPNTTTTIEASIRCAVQSLFVWISACADPYNQASSMAWDLMHAPLPSPAEPSPRSSIIQSLGGRKLQMCTAINPCGEQTSRFPTTSPKQSRRTSVQCV